MKKNINRSRLIYLLVVLGIILVVVFFLYQKYTDSDSFAYGVEIGSIPVKGMDKDKAVEVVNQGVAEFSEITVTFYRDDYRQDSKLGDLCLPVDIGSVVESAWEVEQDRSWLAKTANLLHREKIAYPVTIAYDSAKIDILTEDWNTQWGKAAKDATLEIDNQKGLVIVPSETGTKVNGQLILDSLPQEMGKIAVVEIPIEIETVEPQVTADMLQNMGQLSSYYTNFNTGEVNRSHNLQMATASINKTVLAPGKVFSFNNTVGQRTMEKGYRDAMIIVGNKFEPGLGGGICQVSSTLYNSVLLAGLSIVERHNHNLAVAYVPLGRDATVAYGIQDFKFKNNTEHPVYIWAVTAGGRLTISIYGNLVNKQKTNIYNIIDKTLDFTTVFEEDSTLEPGTEKIAHGGQNGYVVRSFRSFLGSDGAIIKTEQLATDTYRPLNKVVLQGPAPEPVFVDEPPTPDPEKPKIPQPSVPDQEGSDEAPLNKPEIRP